VPSTTKLNPFGADLRAAMTSAKTKKITPALMKLIGAKDSDKDKATNAAEIKADTLPGDPKSKPAK
jgi:Zn-dependent protease with chaperone function